MGQKIINNLRDVKVENYTGGNSVVNHYYAPQSEANADEKKSETTIFLSYNWHDGETANRIDKHLSKFSGIVVKRDIRDIGPWKSIREFMKSIRQEDYAILIVSDSYLKSKNCMFEVMEVMKEREYADKIFPAVVERSIYDPLVRAEYIKYWQQESDKLEESLKGIELANTAELAADLKHFKHIASSMGEFLATVADMNNPDIRDIEVQIEKAVLKN